MSNTPETDANQIFLGFNPDEGDYFVPAEIARKLEQQRNEAVNNYETAVLREHRMQDQRDWYKAACDKYSEDETINTLCSLKEQRDKAEETAERYRLDANRFEAEVMMLKEQIKEFKDTLTVCIDNFSSKTFVSQKWELPPYDEQGKGTSIE